MTEKINAQQNKNKPFRGQSLVELALLLPILLLLIIGALEFGRLFFTKIVITNAAREGAYYLSSIDAADYDNAEKAAIAEAANSGIPDITVTFPASTTDYDSIIVRVETKVRNLLVLKIIGNALTATNYDEFPLSSSVEMMVQ